MVTTKAHLAPGKANYNSNQMSQNGLPTNAARGPYSKSPPRQHHITAGSALPAATITAHGGANLSTSLHPLPIQGHLPQPAFGHPEPSNIKNMGLHILQK